MEPTDLERRRTLGAFYTPPQIVDALLAEALDPVLARRTTEADVLALRVFDPACGDGAFLVPAARRLAERLAGIQSAPTSNEDAFGRVIEAGCIVGMDIDPAAIGACAAALGSDRTLRVGDALVDGADDPPWCDVVVGNPPFLSQLDRRTAVSAERREELRERYPVEAYTDPAALFLLRGLRSLRDGGRMAMVQPLSVLGSRDARGVREAADAEATLSYLWVAGGRVFPDAQVHVCAVGFEKHRSAATKVRLVVGGGFRDVDEVDRGAATWAALGARTMDIPAVDVTPAGVVGDLATCTADFRDAFYRLAPAAREGRATDTRLRIATAGLIDPAHIKWGEDEVRFAGERYVFPVVDQKVVSTDEALVEWIDKRAVPKVLVASQTRVVEACIDITGAYVPVTPLISVVPEDPDALARIAAVLLSPVASALAATQGFGTALSPLALKVSAGFIRRLPLPEGNNHWDEAASLVTLAHEAHDRLERIVLLERAAQRMLKAYDLTNDGPAFSWWSARLRGSRAARNR